MYRYILVFLGLVSAFVLFCFWNHATQPQMYTAKGFEQSLGIDRLGKEFLLETPADLQRFDLISASLEKPAPTEFTPIPKVLHFISTAELPLNEDEETYVSSWRQFHPTWEIKIWSPAEVSSIYGESFAKFVFDSFKNIQRDLIVAKILIEEGGVVVDLDQECIRPIDDLLEMRSCFCGFEPPLFKPILKRRLHISPTVVGASKRHSVSLEWMRIMMDRLDMQVEKDKNKVVIYYTVDTFGSAVEKSLRANPQSVLVLGPTYFCSISPIHISEFESVLSSDSREGKLKKLASKIGLKKMALFSWPQPESRSISHLGGRLTDGQKKIVEKM